MPGGSSTGECYYGLEAPQNGYVRGSDGNGDTFYYTAISEAQSAVTTYGQTGSQKVIIILGDGDENIAGPDACKKSIANAETAEAAGIWLITIAYNSTDGATSGCVTDYSNTYHGTLAISPECSMHLIADNPVTDNTAFPGFPATAQNYTQITQAEMNDICGTDSTSDTQVTGSRYFNATNDADLSAVFQEIGESLSTERLVSDSAS